MRVPDVLHLKGARHLDEDTKLLIIQLLTLPTKIKKLFEVMAVPCAVVMLVDSKKVVISLV